MKTLFSNVRNFRIRYLAQMMLTAIYHMLSNGEFFNPALYEKAQCKPGFIVSTEEHALKLLR